MFYNSITYAMKTFFVSSILILTGTFCQVKSQEPFVGHYFLSEGPDSKTVAFMQSPAGGYVSVAYGGDTGSRNLYIFRYNEQGDISWSRKYPSPGTRGAVNRFPIAADMAPDGGLYILAVQAIPQIQSNVVLRTNAQGDSLWSTTVSSIEIWAGPPFYVIRTHPDGGCVIAGTSNGFPASSTVTRLDDSGNIAWVRDGFEGEYGYNSFNAVDVNSDGEIFLTGRVQNNQNGNEKVQTSKISSQGNIEWSKVFFAGNSISGDSIMGNGNSIIATPDGGCIFGGWATDPGEPGGRAFLQKLDASGNTQWVKKFFRWEYLYQQARVLDISKQTSGNYICLIHQFYGNSNATPTLMKFTPEGDSLWTQYGAGRRWRMTGTDDQDNILLFGNEPHPDADWYEHSLIVRTTPGGVFNAPQCFTPSNYESGISLNPAVRWNSEHRGSSRFILATDSVFNNTKVDLSGINGTSYEATNLISNTTYYWKAQIFGPEGGGSPWSNVFRFTTGDFTGTEKNISMVNNLSFYPSPASHNSYLSFSLNEPQTVAISIINTLGQTVFTADNKILPQGEHYYNLNVSDWAEGIYVCYLRAGANILFRKILVTH